MGYLSEFFFSELSISGEPLDFRQSKTYVIHAYYCTVYFLIARLVIATFRFV